jgi:hypothetical protein
MPGLPGGASGFGQRHQGPQAEDDHGRRAESSRAASAGVGALGRRASITASARSSASSSSRGPLASTHWAGRPWACSQGSSSSNSLRAHFVRQCSRAPCDTHFDTRCVMRGAQPTRTNSPGATRRGAVWASSKAVRRARVCAASSTRMTVLFMAGSLSGSRMRRRGAGTVSSLACIETYGDKAPPFAGFWLAPRQSGLSKGE